MAKDYNASLRFRALELESAGMRGLFEVQVQASPCLYDYWTDFNATVSYFKPNTNTPQDYSPVPMAIGALETDDGTKIPAVNVNIGAVDQTIVSYIENQDALRRNRVRYIMVAADELANASACFVNTFYIDGAAIDHSEETATFELTSRGAVVNVTVPLRNIRRDQCPYKYKNASTCQYAGAEATCRHTKDACASKNNVINFGGFPGVGTRKVRF